MNDDERVWELYKDQIHGWHPTDEQLAAVLKRCREQVAAWHKHCAEYAQREDALEGRR